MSTKTSTIIILIVGIIAFGIGRSQKSVEIREVEVVKTVEVVDIVEKIIEKPNGERIITRRTNKHATSDAVRTKDKKVTPDRPEYSVSLSASSDALYSSTPVYTLGVSKRVLGELSIGLYARTDKEYGLTILYNF